MDSIKNRFIRIISSEGLTSSAFADLIGVQRSSISHILSGRNKPSLDFLQKIITKFPKYNAEWLIVGTGEMYKQPKQTNIFNTEELIKDTSVKSEEEPINTELPPKNDHIPINKVENISNNLDALAEKATTTKHITKIVVFFNDATFKEYSPSND